VRYFYAWTPLVTVGTVALLSMPWLGLIALVIVAMVPLGALAALAWAVVLVARMLSRAIARRWHMPSGAAPKTAAVLSPARRQNVWLGAPSHPAALSVNRELHSAQHTFPDGHVS
jgi:hypothetical protein